MGEGGVEGVIVKWRVIMESRWVIRSTKGHRGSGGGHCEVDGVVTEWRGSSRSRGGHCGSGGGYCEVDWVVTEWKGSL